MGLRQQRIKDEERVLRYVLLSRLQSLQELHGAAVQWNGAFRGRTITDASTEDMSIESIHCVNFNMSLTVLVYDRLEQMGVRV